VHVNASDLLPETVPHPPEQQAALGQGISCRGGVTCPSRLAIQHEVTVAVEVSGCASVVGRDIGSHRAVYCVCQPDKSQVVKPTELATSRTGFEALEQRLRQLALPPQRILIGLEATGRYSENL